MSGALEPGVRWVRNRASSLFAGQLAVSVEQRREVVSLTRAELAVGVSQVQLDGLGRDEQRFGDRAVGLAGGGAFGDAPL